MMDRQTGFTSGSAPLSDLIVDLFQGAAKLTSQELSLLRAEMEGKFKRVAVGASLLVAAAVFAVVALSLSVDTLVAWLTIVTGSQVVASLLCSFIAAATAAVLFFLARKQFNAGGLKPRRFSRSIGADINMVLGRR